MTDTGRAEANARRREAIMEWAQIFAVVVLPLAAVILAVALAVFLFQHPGDVVGILLTVIKLTLAAAVVGALLTGVVVAWNIVYVKLVEKNSPVLPSAIAACAAALAGAAATDILRTTVERIALPVILAIMATVAVSIYDKRKKVAIGLFLLVPISLVGAFFTRPSKWRQDWLHEQGIDGLLYAVLTLVLLGVAFAVMHFFDQRKNPAKQAP